MRLRRAITVGALLLMSASMTACGGDDDKGSGNSDGDGRTGASASSGKGGGAAGTKLPEASDMASIAYYLNQYGSCLDLKQGAEYDDSSLADHDPAWGDENMTRDAAWGIKERAVCRDDYDDSSTLLLLSDMKKFQTSMHAKNYGSILIGKDFAVQPGGTETIQDLKASGLVVLSCDPERKIPSGYKQEPAQVDGCVLTNYYAN
ncbi:hypothetical protein JHN52_24350 [Streptomyces sp. MBT97]|uniref:hypothetical protein n=1 Tax=Streptomyces sp. MBT97 TaxID=2800411 RepID=UPI001909EEA4|nr:hypothetical protein [Streptomyces sp. MBT97]MBK3636000.1 hypothetical protein [Streptomyces sp. MBT97]